MSITPTSRLLLATAAVLFPLAVAATAWPGAILVWGGAACLFILAVGLDAVRAQNRLDGIRLEVPDVLRLSKGRTAELMVRIINPRLRVRRLRLGLALPDSVHAKFRDRVVALPGEEEQSRIAWPLRAVRQGRYTLDRGFIGADSPWGWWLRRAAVDTPCEIRCYPNLMGEKQMSALFMHRQMGSHPQRQIGKGRDFEQLREYCHGDSYEDIHWKATARRGYPVTKVYQVERMQKVYVMIDASRLSTRYPAGSCHAETAGDGADSAETIFERYVAAALILGMAAERGGDHFGILPFADRVDGFIRAKTGTAHYNACRDMLYTLSARNVTPDFSELFTFIGTRIRKRALMIFLTNLDDPILAESFTRHIGTISRRHLVVVNMANPVGARPVFATPAVDTLDDLYGALGSHLVWTNLRDTGKRLRRQGADFSLIDNENLCARLVSQYLGIKQRQVL